MILPRDLAISLMLTRNGKAHIPANELDSLPFLSPSHKIKRVSGNPHMKIVDKGVNNNYRHVLPLSLGSLTNKKKKNLK